MLVMVSSVFMSVMLSLLLAQLVLLTDSPWR